MPTADGFHGSCHCLCLCARGVVCVITSATKDALQATKNRNMKSISLSFYNSCQEGSTPLSLQLSRKERENQDSREIRNY